MRSLFRLWLSLVVLFPLLSLAQQQQAPLSAEEVAKRNRIEKELESVEGDAQVVGVAAFTGHGHGDGESSGMRVHVAGGLVWRRPFRKHRAGWCAGRARAPSPCRN